MGRDGTQQGVFSTSDMTGINESGGTESPWHRYKWLYFDASRSNSKYSGTSVRPLSLVFNAIIKN